MASGPCCLSLYWVDWEVWPQVITWKYVPIYKPKSTVITSKEEELPWLQDFVCDPQASSGESFIVQMNLWHPYEACSLDKRHTWVWRTRHKPIGVFCLKYSDCCGRKAVVRRVGPTEVGQHCAEPTSFSTLRLTPTLPWLPSWRAQKGWLHMCKQCGWVCTMKWDEKSVLHKRLSPEKL